MIANMMITNMIGAILSVIEVAADVPEGNRFAKELKTYCARSNIGSGRSTFFCRE